MSDRHFARRLERYKEEHAERMGWRGTPWLEDVGKLREAETYAFEMMECEDTYQSYDPLTVAAALLRSEDPKEVTA